MLRRWRDAKEVENPGVSKVRAAAAPGRPARPRELARSSCRKASLTLSACTWHAWPEPVVTAGGQPLRGQRLLPCVPAGSADESLKLPGASFVTWPSTERCLPQPGAKPGARRAQPLLHRTAWSAGSRWSPPAQRWKPPTDTPKSTNDPHRAPPCCGAAGIAICNSANSSPTAAEIKEAPRARTMRRSGCRSPRDHARNTYLQSSVITVASTCRPAFSSIRLSCLTLNPHIARTDRRRHRE